MRLVDKRFAGMAVGVGSARIVGRIHSCALRVGASFISTSVTVLDQKDGPQFLFGLDNLKRHQCAIDLAAGELRIGSCSVALPFLGAHAVPQDFNTKRMQPEDAVRPSLHSRKRALMCAGCAYACTGGGRQGSCSSGALPMPVPACTPQAVHGRCSIAAQPRECTSCACMQDQVTLAMCVSMVYIWACSCVWPRERGLRQGPVLPTWCCPACSEDAVRWRINMLILLAFNGAATGLHARRQQDCMRVSHAGLGCR